MRKISLKIGKWKCALTLSYPVVLSKEFELNVILKYETSPKPPKESQIIIAKPLSSKISPVYFGCPVEEHCISLG